MTKRNEEKMVKRGKKGGEKRGDLHEGDLLPEDKAVSGKMDENGADINEDNDDNGRGVLKTIVRQAKKGEAKQQELYLKYIDVFSKTGKDEEDEEVVYETEFVDDKDKKN
ncbi:MAG: hypothetical protein JW984_05660 [Deltaproteobacteria bacterium]|uniref:Uncharacterized protein n=1 Tax=Candidatus Zymogenus saltonus TaxID=2844893 RepID=A0A9D8KEM8_9DELT|nr:hypothetical protein [Candidatus Zymogenus saltonus]